MYSIPIKELSYKQARLAIDEVVIMTGKLEAIAQDGKVYGIPIEELSYRQARLAIDFSINTHPWLLENIGEFGTDWFVEPDKEYDSLRLQFKDSETETYFKLAWMQRDHSETGA